MRMNGLSSKQAVPESTSENWCIQRIYFHIGVFLCLLPLGGCRDWEWTDFEFINQSNNKISITVSGVTPNPSPGNMGGNTDGSGSKAGLHFAEPAHFDDKIKITWTIGEDETKHEQEFKRDDLGIPAVVNGGTITFVYTKDGKWEIKYSK